MKIERFKSTGLAHFSYIVGSGSEACIIDPRRDIEDYLGYCNLNGMQIKYVFETHRNEDYIIGSLELKKVIPNIDKSLFPN